MRKSPRVLAVVSLLLAGCGGSELDGAEQEAAQPEQLQSVPAGETESGTVHAAWTSCVTVTNQPPLSGCQTRDHWKMNTASYCPSGYVGTNVVAHTACSASGYYQYADITCCQ